MKGTKLVLIQMITVVTTVADELEEKFIKYYNQIMSMMKRLMADVLNEEDQVLVGKTVECVTAIGMAVGKDKVGSNSIYVYYNITKRLCCMYVCSDSAYLKPHPLQFMQDAGEVMQLLLKVHTEQGEELEDDDPQVSSQTRLLQVMMMSLPVTLGSLHDQCLGSYV